MNELITLHIIDEGYGWYAYSTTGEREAVIFTTDFDEGVATYPDLEPEYRTYSASFLRWQSLIEQATGKPWNKLIQALDYAGCEEFPTGWLALAEAQMEKNGYRFALKDYDRHPV